MRASSYFLLVFLLSVPFWILGAAIDEIPKELLPIDLPVGALMAFAPAITALFLIFRQEGLCARSMSGKSRRCAGVTSLRC